MTPDTTACRLRTLRQRSGLTQAELSKILGFLTEIPVSRHERSVTVPNLLTAIGYEVVFRSSVSELFPGLYQTVEAGIEARLEALEKELHQSTAKGRTAAEIARKLEFLCERKEIEPIPPAA
jgi:DNA-binding XRE family transcriptional regulator